MLARIKLFVVSMNRLTNLTTKIYADGADMRGMLEMYRNPLIKGMTTNPTLMKKAGITDYEHFAKDLLSSVTEKPVSFEVFADEFDDMRRQALQIANWGRNVYVKIPISNPRGESSVPLIRDLASAGVKVNVTAILTDRQAGEVIGVLNANVPAVVSIFAGRISDTGVNPMPTMANARRMMDHLPHAELLWASVREVYNIYQADEVGSHIVTVPHDILRKAIEISGTDLEALSLDTVRMFDRDAKSAGFRLDVPPVIVSMPSSPAIPAVAA
jgi:transaldolase